MLFVFQLLRRSGRWSPGGCGCWTAGHVWRLRRSRVHLRILGTCYVTALQGGAPRVTVAEGRHPPLGFSHRKALSSVSLQAQRAAHWEEGRTSLCIFSLSERMVLVAYDGMCPIYECPGNVNWWQYNIFWLCSFPIEIPWSFHWLSLVIRRFWKVIY